MKITRTNSIIHIWVFFGGVFKKIFFGVSPVTCDSRGHCATQGSDCCHGNLLRGVLGGAGVARGHHVGLQKGALQVNVVVRQGLVHCS